MSKITPIWEREPVAKQEAARTCGIDGCENPRWARMWCGKHYARWHRTGSPTTPSRFDLTLEERFWSKVDKSGDCWTWQGTRGHHGHGALKVAGSMVAAHRLSWEFANGAIPPGAYICHRCDNPPCVRPDHLYAGDATTNMSDRVERGDPNGWMRGEDHGNAVLAESDVTDIRNLYQTGQWTQRELAARFGVAQVNVGRIVRREQWRHIS